VLSSLIALSALGQTINVMTLGGLAPGSEILVDVSLEMSRRRASCISVSISGTRSNLKMSLTEPVLKDADGVYLAGE
jgi:hypothetical protein